MNKQILIIEDDEDIAELIRLHLADLGHETMVCHDGEAGWKSYRQRRFDVVILDLMLPKESSLLVLHEIRELDGNVEILILPSSEQIHDRVTALIQGADDYLVQPFSVDDLHAGIQSLMYRKSSSDTASKRSLAATESSTHINRLIENLLRRWLNKNKYHI